MIVKKMTKGPEHHFFGFHDLPITSAGNNTWLGLGVERIDRPPMGGDTARVIVWNENEFVPRVLTQTRNFNFPQGARQQWLGQSETVIVNGEGPNGQPISSLHDATDGKQTGQLSEATYCSNADGTRSFTVDFGRLHRLGGYGHSTMADRTPGDPSPAANGIFLTEVTADRTDLLLSIDTVRRSAGLDLTTTGAHFLTHLRLSPANRRLAFLHRFRLADGGEETCLWTIGTDASNLRLLLRGFLSHFEWIDEKTLLIWGRRNQTIAAMRRSPILNNPLARAVLPLVKGPIRTLVGKSKSMSQSYLKVADVDNPEPTVFASTVLKIDGHPMANPVKQGVIVTDTYPNDDGIRELMLYHNASGERIDLGRFRKIDEVPSAATVAEVKAHLEATVAVHIAADLYSFTRSGLHCDLHPRWTSDGRSVAFDSIHEGTRQIYAVPVQIDHYADRAT